MNEGIVAGDDFVADVLGDALLDEVDTVELDNVVEEVVNDVSNNLVLFESHGFENVLLHWAKCSILSRGVIDKFTNVSHLMKSNKKYMRTLGSLLQESADYCFVIINVLTVGEFYCFTGFFVFLIHVLFIYLFILFFMF